MTKQNHLNGPWEVEGEYIVPKGEQGNALFYSLDGDDSINNLAAAAPVLLGALEMIDAYWTEDFPDGPDTKFSENSCVTFPEDTIKVWRSIRSAIAKAKGESQ